MGAGRPVGLTAALRPFASGWPPQPPVVVTSFATMTVTEAGDLMRMFSRAYNRPVAALLGVSQKSS